MPALPPGTCRDAFRRYYLIAGTRNAGLVLERLSRSKGKAAKIAASNGGWRPLPREQLMRECLLSRNQCDRALASLRAKNLIETSQHWHQPAGAHVMHVRMLPELPTEK